MSDLIIKGGEYWTPDIHVSKKYFVKKIGNEIHCYTGKKCDGVYSGSGNVIFNKANTIAKDVVEWLKDKPTVVQEVKAANTPAPSTDKTTVDTSKTQNVVAAAKVAMK